MKFVFVAGWFSWLSKLNIFASVKRIVCWILINVCLLPQLLIRFIYKKKTFWGQIFQPRPFASHQFPVYIFVKHLLLNFKYVSFCTLVLLSCCICYIYPDSTGIQYLAELILNVVLAHRAATGSCISKDEIYLSVCSCIQNTHSRTPILEYI